MEDIKLLSCPFCGARMHDDWRTISQFDKDQWVVNHCCYFNPKTNDIGVCINVYGNTKEQVVARWNERAGNVMKKIEV